MTRDEATTDRLIARLLQGAEATQQVGERLAAAREEQRTLRRDVDRLLTRVLDGNGGSLASQVAEVKSGLDDIRRRLLKQEEGGRRWQDRAWNLAAALLVGLVVGFFGRHLEACVPRRTPPPPAAAQGN